MYVYYYCYLTGLGGVLEGVGVGGPSRGVVNDLANGLTGGQLKGEAVVLTVHNLVGAGDEVASQLSVLDLKESGSVSALLVIGRVRGDRGETAGHTDGGTESDLDDGAGEEKSGDLHCCSCWAWRVGKLVESC